MLLVSWIGKIIIALSRGLGRGHGSALPGLVVEKLYPNFLGRLLDRLPDGVVLISGTNGKTTTTKIVADLLRADGYRVFTNTSGSNFTRGVISAALPQMKRGKLEVDIAVLELDEAYATRFVDQVKPRYALLLNVFRDQLDRFGEIDHTADLLKYVAEKTSGVVVLNEDDPRIRRISRDARVKANIAWFGYDGQASQYYTSDDELHSQKVVTSKSVSKQSVRVVGLNDNVATYQLADETRSVKLRLFGIHNALNCAAALSLVRQIEGDKFVMERVVDNLGKIRPAFGRGEIILVGDASVQLILVKNPSGFQLSLNSASGSPAMIAINDAYADGRDVSWLWDVSFVGLANVDYVSGIRADDMAIRLTYDGVSCANIETDISVATRRFVKKLGRGDGQIFATYTAMLKIRDVLEQMSNEVNNG